MQHMQNVIDRVNIEPIHVNEYHKAIEKLLTGNEEVDSKAMFSLPSWKRMAWKSHPILRGLLGTGSFGDLYRQKHTSTQGSLWSLPYTCQVYSLSLSFFLCWPCSLRGMHDETCKAKAICWSRQTAWHTTAGVPDCWWSSHEGELHIWQEYGLHIVGLKDRPEQVAIATTSSSGPIMANRVLWFVLHVLTESYRIPYSYHFTKQVCCLDTYQWIKEVIQKI